MALLDAEKASQEMQKAAENLDQAAQKLQQGQSPQQEQKQAEENIKKAEANLKQREDQFQEELFRERLVKIAKKIQGLKKRQDAALEESERLHEKVLEKGWYHEGGFALIATLLGNQETQQGLAEETSQLSQSLKETIVFEMILEKAAKNMDKAAAIMKKRMEKAGGEFPFPFTKEKLAEEESLHAQTVQVQQLARERLQRLIDALGAEIEASKKRTLQAQNEPNGGEGNEPQQQKKGIRPQDGIPPLAELRALREEQLDLNKRTKEFHDKHADQQLTPEKARQLAELQAEQAALSQLTQEMVTAMNKKAGENP